MRLALFSASLLARTDGPDGVCAIEAEPEGALTLPLSPAFSRSLGCIDTVDDVGDIRSHGRRCQFRLTMPFRMGLRLIRG